MIKTNTNAIVNEEMLHDEVPFKLQVSNIQQLTDEQINGLKVGDVIAKKTGNQFHSYRVSYKEDKQGICLTYSDASLVETVSYDYVEGHWVYNSTDVTELGVEELPSITGNANKYLKVNSGATDVEWGEVSGGTKLYLHEVSLSAIPSYNESHFEFEISSENVVPSTLTPTTSVSIYNKTSTSSYGDKRIFLIKYTNAQVTGPGNLFDYCVAIKEIKFGTSTYQLVSRDGSNVYVITTQTGTYPAKLIFEKTSWNLNNVTISSDTVTEL